MRQILSFTKTMVCFYNDATGRGLIAGKTLLCLVFILLFLPGTLAQRRVDSPDRGIVAIPKSANTIYLSWRHFATDPDEIAYNLYYKTSAEGALTKLNSNPVTGSTNYTANLSTSASAYTFVVKSVLEGWKRRSGQLHSASKQWNTPHRPGF